VAAGVAGQGGEEAVDGQEVGPPPAVGDGESGAAVAEVGDGGVVVGGQDGGAGRAEDVVIGGRAGVAGSEAVQDLKAGEDAEPVLGGVEMVKASSVSWWLVKARGLLERTFELSGAPSWRSPGLTR
jgi:hypothetical protein